MQVPEFGSVYKVVDARTKELVASRRKKYSILSAQASVNWCGRYARGWQNQTSNRQFFLSIFKTEIEIETAAGKCVKMETLNKRSN